MINFTRWLHFHRDLIQQHASSLDNGATLYRRIGVEDRTTDGVSTLAYIYHNSNDVKEEGAISCINQDEILTKAVLLGHGTSANPGDPGEFAPLRREGVTQQLVVLPAPKHERG